jgi:hypothetical protein
MILEAPNIPGAKSHIHFSVLGSFCQTIRPGPRLWDVFRNRLEFLRWGGGVIPRPTPKLEDHPLSAVRDCLFSIFAATLHIWRPSPPATWGRPIPWWQGTHLTWLYLLSLSLKKCQGGVPALKKAPAHRPELPWFGNSAAEKEMRLKSGTFQNHKISDTTSCVGGPEVVVTWKLTTAGTFSILSNIRPSSEYKSFFGLQLHAVGVTG